MPLYLETWKNLEFGNLGKKNLEKPVVREILKKKLEFLTIFTCSVVKIRFDTNIFHINEIFLSSSKIFLLKNTFKVTLQYLSMFFIVFNTVFTLNLALVQKCVFLKTLKKFGKPEKKLEKTSSNPV